MERFQEYRIPEQNEAQLAAYKSDLEWKRIYSFLRRGYWHVTSPKAWKAILKSRAIKPNVSGVYPTTFGDISEKSYGYKHECVSLFDFVKPTEDDVIREWGNAWDFLCHLAEQNAVLCRLDRRRLRSQIIPNSEAWQRADGKYFGVIKYLEVWYPKAISTKAITHVFRLPPMSQFGVLNPEPISKTAIVQPTSRREVIETNCGKDITEQQAIQYLLNHPNGPLPPEVTALVGHLFKKE